jgi:hypothetical protein
MRETDGGFCCSYALNTGTAGKIVGIKDLTAGFYRPWGELMKVLNLLFGGTSFVE